MRKNFLYLFYAVTSGFVLLALHQDLQRILYTTQATEPQYVFIQKSDKDAEKKKQEELEILRQWAKEYNPDNVRQ